MYAHHPSYRLEPRTLGIALTRGLVGHEALEVYYKNIMEGKSEEDARKLSQEFVMTRTLKEITTGDSEKARMMGELGVLLMSYYDANMDVIKNYDIIGVEHKVIAPLPNTDINFAGRIDLVLSIPSGPNRGEAIPWDHKFTYNFWPEIAVQLNAQISNYIWALNELGYRSRTGVLNMSRYRADAIEKFKQEDVPTNSTMREAFIKNHAVAAEQIVDLKLQNRVGINEGVTRSASKFNCEYCPFSKLCLTESKGLDSSTMIKASFRPNSYGYDSELDVD